MGARESLVPATAQSEMGKRLRAARKRQGVALRELARRVGVSASLISQIETSKTWPAVGTLYAIVTELELSLDELFAASGPRPARAEANGFHIRRSAERKELRLASGVRWEQLTPVTEPGIDFLEITYPPGSESSERERSMRHQGREYGLILEGTLHVRVGGGTCELAAGDTISFDSSLPHRLWNQGSESARAVWIVLGRSGNGG